MIRICTLASLILALSGPRQELRLVTHFCPECWRFAAEDGEWSRDEAGRCWTCGKPSVEVEAALLTWWWCSRREAWVGAPCAEAGGAPCDEARTARALVPGPGERPERARFCPDCVSFESMEAPPIRCRQCERPPVRAGALTRSWVWCGSRRAWSAAPCPDSAEEGCCVTHSGRLLAAP